MGAIGRAGRSGKKVFEKALKEFPGAITATWKLKTGGTFDKFKNEYAGATEVPKTSTFAAIVESNKIKFIYPHYGIDETKDIIAMVSVDLVVPPTDAVYHVVANNSKYTLVDVHFEANYGTDSTGKQLFAFKVLHLRAA